MTRAQRHRRSAFIRQGGLCFYCRQPMLPPGQLHALAQHLDISERVASEIQCTAEHLQARCDEGTDRHDNIVAAHRECNNRRHRMKPAPPPDTLTSLVQAQLQAGCWFRRPVQRALDQMRKSPPTP